MTGWAVLFGCMGSGLRNWYAASMYKLDCTMSELIGREMVPFARAHLWAIGYSAGAGLHPAHRQQATWVCSHLCRFAPKEMKIQDISFTPLFSANSFHTQNWMEYFSAEHESAYTNISMQDQDIHGKHVRPVEIFCVSSLTGFQIHKSRKIMNKKFR